MLTALLRLHSDLVRQWSVADIGQGQHGYCVRPVGHKVADRGQLAVVHGMNGPKGRWHIRGQRVVDFVALDNMK